MAIPLDAMSQPAASALATGRRGLPWSGGGIQVAQAGPVDEVLQLWRANRESGGALSAQLNEAVLSLPLPDRLEFQRRTLEEATGSEDTPGYEPQIPLGQRDQDFRDIERMVDAFTRPDQPARSALPPPGALAADPTLGVPAPTTVPPLGSQPLPVSAQRTTGGLARPQDAMEVPAHMRQGALPGPRAAPPPGGSVPLPGPPAPAPPEWQGLSPWRVGGDDWQNWRDPPEPPTMPGYAGDRRSLPPAPSPGRPGMAPVPEDPNATWDTIWGGLTDALEWSPQWGTPAVAREQASAAPMMPTGGPGTFPVPGSQQPLSAMPIGGPGTFPVPGVRPQAAPPAGPQNAMAGSPYSMGGGPSGLPGSMRVTPTAAQAAMAQPSVQRAPMTPPAPVSAMPGATGAAGRPVTGVPPSALAAPQVTMPGRRTRATDAMAPEAASAGGEWGLPAMLAGAAMMAAGEQGASPFGALAQGLSTGLGAYALNAQEAAEAERAAREEEREERRLTLEELKAEREANERDLRAITTSSDGVLKFYDANTGEIITPTTDGDPISLRQPSSGGGSGGLTARDNAILDTLIAAGVPPQQAAIAIFAPRLLPEGGPELGTITQAAVDERAMAIANADENFDGVRPTAEHERQALEELAAQRDVFATLGQPAQQQGAQDAMGLPLVTTQQEVDQLPPGTRFRDADGNEYVKD